MAIGSKGGSSGWGLFSSMSSPASEESRKSNTSRCTIDRGLNLYFIDRAILYVLLLEYRRNIPPCLRAVSGRALIDLIELWLS